MSEGVGRLRRLSKNDYARAERFLENNVEKLMFNISLNPQWLGDGQRFWYLRRSREGQEFVLVDSTSGECRPAFDHQKLAAELSEVRHQGYTHDNLPFDEFKYAEGHTAIEFCVDQDKYCFALDDCSLNEVDSSHPLDVRGGTKSPDGQKTAYTDEDDLYVRFSDDRTQRLTDDGEPEHFYGRPIESPLLSVGLTPRGRTHTLARWSPDSRRFVTHRTDARHAGRLTMVQSTPTDGSNRPKAHSYVYALPGDEEVAESQLLICDVQQGSLVEVGVPEIPALYEGSPVGREEDIWWSNDGETVYVLERTRGFRTVRLHAVNPETGQAQVLVEESCQTGLEPYPTAYGRNAHNVRMLPQRGEFIWFSERDGWGHLYLYRETGELKSQLTSGPWLVHDVVFVDEDSGWIYFTAGGREPGRDPYQRHLYRLSLDGDCEPQILTSQDADHRVEFSPGGDYFVDAASRVDMPPSFVLRSADGAQICELERGDIELLEETGWHPPERFSAKARDGQTDVYGVIYRPSNFDRDKTYPVIDSVYPGPHNTRAPVAFADAGSTSSADFWQNQALAELGFIVVSVDGLGTSYRSRRFGDHSYKNLGDGGFEDHITALRQLADRHPYMDLSRVGVWGHSAGGYASTHAVLAHPEFYKVAVSSAGNHDHSLDKASWVERYMGLPQEGQHFEQQANSSWAAKLQGNLLLIHGEVDENVPLSNTLRLVNALIDENKDFDLLIVPNQSHSCGHHPYVVRKRWDYFVEHLMEAEPPSEYRINVE